MVGAKAGRRVLVFEEGVITSEIRICAITCHDPALRGKLQSGWRATFPVRGIFTIIACLQRQYAVQHQFLFLMVEITKIQPSQKSHASLEPGE